MIQNMKSLLVLCIIMLMMRNGFAQEASTLIQDAQIVDGTGKATFTGSVRIRNGLIVALGELDALLGEKVIDAIGHVLSPGFIDTHSHYDRDPDATKLAAISQGITTIIIGQDGSSVYPLAPFYDSLRVNPLAPNLASYVGHGTIRRVAMGDDFRRAATDEETIVMRELLRTELAAGALGLSTGLEYDPGIYSTTEEIIALAKETQAAGGRYISHMRSEDRHLEEAIDEVIRIGREANLPVQISHMKLARRGLWGEAVRILELLNEARTSGVNITADVYPYEYWHSTMTVLFPERDFDNRESAVYALTELVAPDEMIIARYDADTTYVGKTLKEIADLRGADPVTTYMDLIALSREKKAIEKVVARGMTEADIQRLLKWPHTNVCSDGYGGSRHPRGHGTYPRVLRQYVRENAVLSMPEAIHKMTALAAQHVGIEGRGTLEIGAAADLVMFNSATVTDKATFEHPHELSEGISKVWVNGVLVYEEGRPTGVLPGQVLKR